jgi:hypothetical protein
LIEQAFFFAAGFLAASLVAVLGIPVISRRAMRLSRARVSLQAPVGERQAAAERDALRAQFAVERLELERRATRAERASVELRAGLGKYAVKLIELESGASGQGRTILDQASEIERLASERRDMEAELAASQIALHDAFSQRDRAAVIEAAATARRLELEAQASRDRARTAILTAREENLEGLIEELSHRADKAESARAQLNRSLEDERAKVRALEVRLREAVARNDRLAERLSRGAVDHDESRRRLIEQESRIAASDQVREGTLLENGRLLAALADKDAALKDAQAKAAEFEARLTAAGADARASEKAASLHGETLSAAPAAMDGELREARADREALKPENDALRAKVAATGSSMSENGGESALREAIERLGRELARLYAERETADEPGRKARPGEESALAIASSASLMEPSGPMRRGSRSG